MTTACLGSYLLRIHLAEYWLKRRSTEFFIALFVLIACFIFAYVLLMQDSYSLVYYGDAISHLVISRRIVDWITPGLAQLGSVWLPMTHLLLLPFVANDFLFHTGLAGTIVSGLSTAITAIVLYRIVKLQFNSVPGGILSSVLYVSNPSVIYIGIIPMMEALFLMFFMVSVYYIQKWYYTYASGGSIWNQYRSIIICAIAISAASLTRYEAWLLPIGLLFFLLIILFITHKEVLRRRIEAILCVAVPFSFVGIILWILWNFIIFRDPLLFATGPYSAKVQSASREFSQHLHMNPILSLSIIFDVAKAMYGLPMLIISIFGIIAYFYMNIKKKSLWFGTLTVLLLLFPILSDFAAMLEGSGEIYPVGQGWFNSRYLVFIAPFLAFGSTSLVVFISKKVKKQVTISAALILIILSISVFVSQPLVVGRTTAMSDGIMLPFVIDTPIEVITGKMLGKLYDKGNVVMFTPTQHGQHIMFASKLPLKNFIDVASGPYWRDSKNTPWVHGSYVIREKHLGESESTIFDPLKDIFVYWEVHEGTLKNYYHLIYENKNYQILKLN